jgi:hypothetical protein
MKFISVMLALLTSITTTIPDDSDYMTFTPSMFIYGENPIYHVGDTFVNTVGIVHEDLYEYYDSCGLYKVEKDWFDYTKYFTESLVGITFTKSGVYEDTFNGDLGLFRTSVYVYDYGDMNGDFKITINDAVIMSRVIVEDDTANCDYLFNSDTNGDDIVDIFDLNYILNIVDAK